VSVLDEPFHGQLARMLLCVFLAAEGLLLGAEGRGAFVDLDEADEPRDKRREGLLDELGGRCAGAGSVVFCDTVRLCLHMACKQLANVS